MTPGSILCDNEFKYRDGTIGKKILIVFNDGTTGYYIVVKTTSKAHYKGITLGCQLTDRYPNFFLPKGSTCLKLDTWVMLDQFFDLTAHKLLTKSFSGQINRIGLLPDDIFLDLIKCAIDCDDITLEQKDIIKNYL